MGTPRASYIFEFLTPFGVAKERFVDVIEFSYQRQDRKVGEATIYFPARYTNALAPILPPLHAPYNFSRHCQIKIWRSVDGLPHTLEPQTVWLVSKPGDMITRDGEWFVKVDLVDWLWVLKTRKIAYPAGDAHAAYKDIPGDDVAKGWFRDQFTPQIYNAPGRELQTGGYLDVAALKSLAPKISQESSYEELLTVLQDTCDRVYQKSKWMTFDFFSTTGSFPWTFDVRFDQLGKDRTVGATASPVVLSPWQLDTRDFYYANDYANEYTVVYGLGPGTGAARLITSVQDATRIASSPFGWIEQVEQARQGETVDEVSDAANARLRMGEPLPVLVIGIEDSKRYMYGRDYFYGDRISVDFDGNRVPFRIVGVQLSCRDGKELKKFALEYVRI